ncbi:uncharacterized protein LOC111814857, partial [Octodon degus]|uniref:Uncharacterized protein LOC111814857 n=1 Tax=Octodon degus TaxID=10160 RepID=A0A6P6DWX3_OCTDE
MNHEGAKEDKGEAILQASLLGDPKSSSQGCDEWNILETLGDLIDDDELFFSLCETYPQEAGNEDKEAQRMVPRDLPKPEDENNVLKDKMNNNLTDVSQCQAWCDSYQPGKSWTSMTEGDVAPYILNVANNLCSVDEYDEITLDPSKYFAIIHHHAKKLTQLRKMLREGRNASLSLGQHLEFLLTQDIPEIYRAQGHIEHLTVGCKMAEEFVLKLSA